MSAPGDAEPGDLARALIGHFAQRGEFVLDQLARHRPYDYARLVGRVLPRVALAVAAPEPAETPQIIVTIASDPTPSGLPPEAPAAVTYGADTAPEPEPEPLSPAELLRLRGPAW